MALPSVKGNKMPLSRIAVIGCGNMGGAFISGLIKRGYNPEYIHGIDTDKGILTKLEKSTHIKTSTAINEDIEKCDVIVVAVKPVHIGPLLGKLSPHIDSHHLIISVAAGVPLAFLEKCLNKKAAIVRTMPNIAAKVGEAVIALCYNRAVSPEQRDTALDIMSGMGETIELDESLFDAVTGLSGSGPAFVFLMIEALADGGVLMGIPREKALRLAIKTVEGAALYLKETAAHPAVAREMVASPGGTTIEGLHVLENGGFRGLIIDAVKQASIKSARLGEKFDE